MQPNRVRKDVPRGPRTEKCPHRL